MNFTEEERKAANRFTNAMANYSFKLFIGNLLSTVTTAAAIIVPIILTFKFKEFIYLIFLFNYPICVFCMSWLRHSTLMNINFRYFPVLGIFFAVGIISLFLNLTSAPGVISTISIGLIASYHILFNELPVAQNKIEIAQNNPAFKSFREKSSSEISK